MRQDLERKLAAVSVLTVDSKTIAGFYTLSAHSILAADLPESLVKKLPRFPLPVTLLGRMGLSQALHGQRLGEFLLVHAIERAWIGSQQIASWGVVVDAKAGAREFYLKHDFTPLPSNRQIVLPMPTIEKLFWGVERTVRSSPERRGQRAHLRNCKVPNSLQVVHIERMVEVL